MLLDSIVLGCAILAALSLGLLFSHILHFYLAHEVSASKPSSYLNSITNSFFGPLAIGTTLLSQLISTPLILGLLIAICNYLRLKTYWRVLGLALILYVLCNLSTRYWPDFFVGLISGTISLTILWFAVTKAFHRNILSLFMLVWPNLYLRFGWRTVEVWLANFYDRSYPVHNFANTSIFQLVIRVCNA